MQTLQVFMNKHCRHVDIKPRLVRVYGGVHHYTIELRRLGQKMKIPFSMGSGHGSEPPTREQVMNSIAEDVALYRNSSCAEDVADYAGLDMGDPEQARTVREVFARIEALDHKLQRLFTEDQIEELLWQTEGL